ncbi:2-oxoglutarate dehydrogenase, E2 component, dihydrolipoamide succinyltransferase [Actinospongicola halichondriae]|uniref:2-oxoglutarate dehydrogenase, E2 component, dihydrolipoamide succinyltransferase n=1 Tax=Actinospongicola halichondriae TaxID=3236844 RepID=UPI003D591CD1
MADVEMPQLGETVTEGTITRWFKAVGDSVAEDEPLFEVSTDKVDSEVPSPLSGTLSEILVAEGDTVDVGTVLARIGDAGDAPAPAAPAAEAPAAAPEPAAPAAPPPPAPAPSAAPSPAPAPAPASSGSGSKKLLSPVVRKLVNENGLDVDAIVGTGPGGRITRDNVLDAIDAGTARQAPAAAEAPRPAAAAAQRPAAPAPRAGERDTAVPNTRIRKATAEHMRRSIDTSAHAYASIEVDFEAIDRVRRSHKAAFKADEGFSLTYLPFVSRAVVDGIREYPEVNASFGPDELIIHNYVNLGVAVDLDFKGLLVPVIADADGMRLRSIARSVSDLASRARSKKLSPDELSGGTFTITNPGPFGTTITLPVINQPQVAILSTDGVKRRPVVITAADGSESIGIHSVGNITLTWDHRAFDGAYAAAFLKRVKDLLETMDWEQELN